ncbi:MAG: dihydroorotate dehydrogenase electron transfer subunit [Candidatus Heimdallarchaeota archaeon]|nr:MAG: dihydroorotate dehydrogenase electron transfer subunit [Candidatus Heimdallarchaeota archaeon]
MNDILFNLPKCLTIRNKESHNEKTSTLTFSLPFEYSIRPGQYFMLWVPGVDEVPISVSGYHGTHISFTICDVGSASRSLNNKGHTELIGLRGPFGNGFEVEYGKNALIVAGGMGIAPLRFLIQCLTSNITSSQRIVLIQGAKTCNDLLFRSEFERLPIETNFCTEDGSYGFKGFASTKMDLLLGDLIQSDFNLEIFACGPEIFLKKVLYVAQKNKIEKNTQICLADRHIRCGFGICGSCFLDDIGLSLCRDGPVFRGSVLLEVTDFGQYGRKSNGLKYQFH